MRSLNFLSIFALFVGLSCFPIACHSQSETTGLQPPLSSQPKPDRVTVERPTVRQPEIRQPKVEAPQVTIPEVQIPEITFPGIRVQQSQNSTVITIAADILFDFDRATLRPDAEAALRQISTAIAKHYPQNPMQIQGHTDAIGSDSYNQDLSVRRAVAVKQWLQQQGNVAASRMSAIGYGESRPVAANTKADGSDNPEGRQKNRRVEIVIRR
ncbi:MAG: OmpA family protein [Hydrococcus sp. C42_A2020_068]|uniref:OmpA family protein n=1 Tax=Pleurocapsa sp. PCC 7327 TaxID=118163 RepID=UPI00029F8E11|nr:OmpA family protein [Pleurocapsa sp. PCC 7327]AFY79198.1 outer membrane protein/peptidoglycan-associated (lipo)protein [Pleurocapsa sp. PCC 7327]MBF2020691.1 OmpA family protein [Hydrococcus sp. C42_A2020_068]